MLGENKRSLVTKRNWEVIGRLWPALVQAQLKCEKPSVLKLFDDVIDKLHNDIETTEIELMVSERCIHFMRFFRTSVVKLFCETFYKIRFGTTEIQLVVSVASVS